MSDTDSDRELIELVANEQRSFRTILIAGVAALALLVIMSTVLGLYYFNVSQQLTRIANGQQQQTFNARHILAEQSEHVATQELLVRQIHDDMRREFGGSRASENDTEAAALDAVKNYLGVGRLALDAENLIERFAKDPPAPLSGISTAPPSPTRALFKGVYRLIVFSRDEITDTELPKWRKDAQDFFAQAAADPAISGLARTGNAWTLYIVAQNSSYKPADCESVIDAVKQSSAIGPPGAQPLYWQAVCERKIGKIGEALRDYAASLEAMPPQNGDFDIPYMTIAWNGLHGLGSTLIEAKSLPDSDQNLRAALDAAGKFCPSDQGTAATPQMNASLKLAVACLETAVQMRKGLKQPPGQVNGTRQYIGFAYLRVGDFEKAFKNAKDIEGTTLEARNEIIRALSAGELQKTKKLAKDDRAAIESAERNISYFRVSDFSLCELQFLLSDALYEKALKIISDRHGGKPVKCTAS